MPWVGCGGICVGVHGRDELSYAKNLRLPSHILFTATVWSCKEMPVCRVKGCACETSGGVHHRCCVCLCVGGFVSYVIAFYLGCCVLLLNVSLSVCVCGGLLFFARGAAEEEEQLRRVGFSTASVCTFLGFSGVSVLLVGQGINIRFCPGAAVSMCFSWFPVDAVGV